MSDPASLTIESTWCAGQEVYTKGDPWQEEERDTSFPEAFYHSVHVTPRTSGDFTLTAPINEGKVTCRILEVQEHTTFVKEGRAVLSVHHGEIDWEHSPYNLAVVWERHGKTAATEQRSSVGLP